MCQKTQKISKKFFWLASLAKNVQNMSKYPKYVIFIKKAEYVISTYSHIFLESSNVAFLKLIWLIKQSDNTFYFQNIGFC